MSSAAQNKSIARLIVGAMSIDGHLGKEERRKVAKTLDVIGMGELIADVGAAIEDNDGSFDLYDECKSLKSSLGSGFKELSPLIFRMVCDVLASDRYVSAQEALYLSAMARQLGIGSRMAKQTFKEVMAQRRGRLEKCGQDIDADFNPHLKDLLSFEGAEDLVGEIDEDSVDELAHAADDSFYEGSEITRDDMARSLTILGLGIHATLEDAEAVWKETIETLDLPKMAKLGETFVSAAINRITRINDAYKTILHFHERLEEQRKTATYEKTE